MSIEKYQNPAVYGQSLLDLLQASWSLDDDVYERLLKVDAGWLRRWRNHELDFVSKPVWQRLDQLLRLHEAVRLHSPPKRYADFVSRPWREGSFLGERSIIDTALDGDDAIDRISKYLWAIAAGN